MERVRRVSAYTVGASGRFDSTSKIGQIEKTNDNIYAVGITLIVGTLLQRWLKYPLRFESVERLGFIFGSGLIHKIIRIDRN